MVDISCRRRRNAHQRSSLKDPSTFVNTAYGIGAAVPSKSQRPTVKPSQKTDPSANEDAEIREVVPSPGHNTEGDADDEHHLVDNELYARRVESHPPAGSMAMDTTREQDETKGDAHHSLTMADNVLCA